jgi:hypothetical protein
MSGSRPKGTPNVLNRTMTSSMAGRASAIKRMRRRASAARAPYCATNGCASILDVDARTGVARCRVCGYSRRVRLN